MPRKPSRPTIMCDYFTWRLFKRDGFYYADGRSNRPSAGKHSLSTRDEQVAMKRLRDLDHHIAVQRGKARPKTSTADIFIEDGWNRFTTYCERPEMLGGLTKTSLKRYRAVRDKHREFCEYKNILVWNDIDKKSIEAYGTWLAKKNYADATIYLELNLISQILKWMIKTDKILPESSLVVLNLRRSEESDTYCYSREEFLTMIKFCRTDSDLNWLGDIILTLATTGMRIGELVGLRWGDIDLPNNTITLPDNRYSGRGKKLGITRTTKGRRTRRVPIHCFLREVLEKLKQRVDGLVFGGPHGGLGKPDTIRNILIRDVIEPLKNQFPTLAGEIGFEHGRVHSFRHYFVSQAFLSGVSEGEIRSWIGHKDSRIIERYRHLGNDDSQRKMNQIDFFSIEGQTPDVPSSTPSQPKSGGVRDEHDNENDTA